MPDDGLILALDQGTTSSRAVLVDRGGRIVAMAQQDLTQHFPRPGWVEQDPGEIWATQRDTARAALAQAGLTAEGSGGLARVAAIGVTNQRETTVVWDRATGEPVAPAIVWQDRRTADRCEDAARAPGANPSCGARRDWCSIPTSRPPSCAGSSTRCPAVSSAHAPASWPSAPSTPGSLWRLTGGRRHVTDATNASRTLLYDLARGDWDDELLELFGVPPRAAARGPRQLAASSARPTPRCSGRPSLSPASPATSRPPCSVRPAPRRA